MNLLRTRSRVQFKHRKIKVQKIIGYTPQIWSSDEWTWKGIVTQLAIIVAVKDRSRRSGRIKRKRKVAVSGKGLQGDNWLSILWYLSDGVKATVMKAPWWSSKTIKKKRKKRRRRRKVLEIIVVLSTGVPDYTKHMTIHTYLGADLGRYWVDVRQSSNDTSYPVQNQC